MNLNLNDFDVIQYICFKLRLIKVFCMQKGVVFSLNWRICFLLLINNNTFVEQYEQVQFKIKDYPNKFRLNRNETSDCIQFACFSGLRNGNSCFLRSLHQLLVDSSLRKTETEVMAEQVVLWPLFDHWLTRFDPLTPTLTESIAWAREGVRRLAAGVSLDLENFPIFNWPHFSSNFPPFIRPFVIYDPVFEMDW